MLILIGGTLYAITRFSLGNREGYTIRTEDGKVFWLKLYGGGTRVMGACDELKKHLQWGEKGPWFAVQE